ncbi:MAG: hypothetical protein GY748_16055 [Planctomycetaceae bacterium]|nr:hypothetical protein [Planctomycetaceae bacterium]
MNDAEIIEKHHCRTGPVASAFDTTARKGSEGEKAAGAARDFVAEVRNELERAGGISVRPGQEGRGIKRANPDEPTSQQNRKGPVANAFDTTARQVAGGKNAAGVARQFVEDVRQAIERAGGIGDSIGQEGRGIERANPGKTIPEQTGLDQSEQSELLVREPARQGEDGELPVKRGHFRKWSRNWCDGPSSLHLAKLSHEPIRYNLRCHYSPLADLDLD